MSDETLQISPLKFAQLPKAIAILKNYLEGLGEDLKASDLVASLISDQAEGLFDLILLSTGKDRAWLETLSAEEGLEILVKVVEINLTFLTDVLPPLLEKLSAQIGKAQAIAQ